MNPVSTPIRTEIGLLGPTQAPVRAQAQTQTSAETGDGFEASRDSRELLRWQRQTAGMRPASADWLKAVDQQQTQGKPGQELTQKDPVSISERLRQFQAEEARQHVILEQMAKILGVPEKAEPRQSLQIPPWEVPSPAQ